MVLCSLRRGPPGMCVGDGRDIMHKTWVLQISREKTNRGEIQSDTAKDERMTIPTPPPPYREQGSRLPLLPRIHHHRRPSSSSCSFEPSSDVSGMGGGRGLDAAEPLLVVSSLALVSSSAVTPSLSFEYPVRSAASFLRFASGGAQVLVAVRLPAAL